MTFDAMSISMRLQKGNRFRETTVRTVLHPDGSIGGSITDNAWLTPYRSTTATDWQEEKRRIAAKLREWADFLES